MAPAVDELFSVQGKVVLVTGAGSGIGRAIARGFAARGAAVVTVGRTAETIEGAARELAADGLQASPHVLDVTDRPAVERLVQAVVAEHGRLDVLVNNAGVKSAETALEADPATWQRTLDINAHAVLDLCRLALPHMPAQTGSIVNIGSSPSSVASVLGYAAGGADYRLSKAMVHFITQLLAVEAAPRGVIVNAVAPGIVDTPMHGRPRAETEERHRGRIPLGIADPEDFVGPVLFLAGAGARYMTGQILHVNGGMLMHP
jgi:NAD(P)-dependent dehydrogenase (short-subunit alcohol dehydrogenase family)